VAAVLAREPDFAALPASLHPRVVELLRRCLEKHPTRRWHAIADVRIEIETIVGQAKSGLSTPPGSKRSLWARRVLTSVAALVVGVAGGALVTWWSLQPRDRGTTSPSAKEFDLIPPEDYRFSKSGTPRISPDGRLLMYTADRETGETSTWLHSFQGGRDRLLPGVPMAAVWSHDGRSIAFYDQREGRLKRFDVESGVMRSIASSTNVESLAWGRDGTLIVSSRPPGPLQRVQGSGVTPLPISTPGSAGHQFPHLLPDGRHVLFLSGNEIWVAALDGSMVKPLHIQAASRAVYDDDGWLIFSRDNVLFAQRFDADRLETEGDPSPLVEGLDTSVAFSLSDEGTLVYARRNDSIIRRFTWYDADGGQGKETMAPPAPYDTFTLLPDDDNSIVAHIAEPGRVGNLWKVDLESGAWYRITSGRHVDTKPVVSHDGASLAFFSSRSRPIGVFRMPLHASVPEPTLFFRHPDRPTYHTDWSRNWLIVDLAKSRGKFDIGYVQAEDLSSLKVIQREFSQAFGVLSGDERFIAYASDESGRYRIHVAPFPPSSSGGWDKVEVSGPEGGTWPRWCDNPPGIAYAGPAGAIMMVPLTVRNGRVESGRPRQVLPIPNFAGSPVQLNPNWVTTKDCKRFLIAVQTGQQALVELTTVVNWTDLRRQASN
jgi:hypothetical protein